MSLSSEVSALATRIGQEINTVRGEIPSTAADVGAQPAGDYATNGYVNQAIGGLAAVATTGSYTDLTGTPTIPSTPGQVGAAPASHSHGVGDLTATGTPSASTYLRGDGTWATPEGGGIEGVGQPEGVVTATPGTVYTDTAGTNGAWKWLKTSGTGNTGWVVTQGDTGWRDLSASLDPVILHPEWGSSSYFQVRRVNNTISLSLGIEIVENLPCQYGEATGVSLPIGLRGDARTIQLPATSMDSEMKRGRALLIYGNGPVYFLPAWGKTTLGSGGDASIHYTGTVHSSEPWPSVLPGTPA